MAYIEQINVGGTSYDIVDSANIATLEATNTASKAYSKGDYLIYDGKLYIVTANIAQGGTITSGTNVSETSVGAEISNIGTVVSVSEPTTTIPGGTTTNVGSIALAAGTWVVCASVQFSTGFSELTLLSISGAYVTGAVRGAGTGGGGLSTSIIHTSTESKTLTLQVYQASSSNKTINQVQFRAVRIK